MQSKACALCESNDAQRWADLAGIEMAERDVIYTIARGLSVMLGKGHQSGDARNERYGLNPIEWIFDWVEEAVDDKFG